MVMGEKEKTKQNYLSIKLDKASVNAEIPNKGEDYKLSDRILHVFFSAYCACLYNLVK
jgi:hypothetical protein